MLVSQRAFGPDSSLPGAPFKEGSSNAPMDSKRSSNGGGGEDDGGSGTARLLSSTVQLTTVYNHYDGRCRARRRS